MPVIPVDFRNKRRADDRPALRSWTSPLADMADAYARLFGGMANAYGNFARALREGDEDCRPSDTEPPGAA